MKTFSGAVALTATIIGIAVVTLVSTTVHAGQTDAQTINPAEHKFNDETQQDRANALPTNEEYNQGYKTHKNTFTKTADGGFDIK